MKKLTSILLSAALGVVFHAGITPFFPSAGCPVIQRASAEDWRGEFDDICKKTNDAMSLSKEELRQLVARCDKLKAVIGTLEETEKKVFLKRLRLCQELFVYVLDSKEKQ
ncbi:MAG: hypothetical protein EPN25_11135 [Nitrospirae bacterium]|nr:MAG: hypothetical protein EPN25_11135 [Nitrospirota bacterium]